MLPSGAVCCWGQANAGPESPQPPASPKIAVASINDRLSGEAKAPAQIQDAKAPPFLIQHGTADCNVPPQQGKLLADALAPLIGAEKVTYTLIPGAGHGGSQFSAADNQKLVMDFLAKALK